MGHREGDDEDAGVVGSVATAAELGRSWWGVGREIDV